MIRILQYIEYTTGTVDSHPLVRGAAWYITRGLVASLLSVVWVSFVAAAASHCLTGTEALLVRTSRRGGTAALSLYTYGSHRDAFP